ncbi:MAG: saccharopine dehydrogenase C-terminal domain-containing protein [Acidimicrobiales bacterium]
MAFPGRILVLGLGAVSRCTLPLLLRHIDAPPGAYTVLDFNPLPDHERWAREAGINVVRDRVTQDNLEVLLADHAGPGDLLLDLAWSIDTITILDWCRRHGVRYLNASVEVWDAFEDAERLQPRDRTLYARQMAIRAMIDRWGSNDGPSAVVDHGANPGLVSHFTKVALEDIAHALLDDEPSGPLAEQVTEALAEERYNRLAQLLEVKVIHISERDTQISREPKRVDEFVNTWSIEGFYEESVAPAELGWGTHERRLPPSAQEHLTGPRNQICLGRMGCDTWVRSWVPCGEIVGMVIRHGEAFSISEHLTVVDGHGVPVYRPTVHYAYCPADAAVASLHELRMRRYRLQPDHRVMGDDITSGRDELGVLLMGHRYQSWWTGSLLDIDESRKLVPHQNATTLQVAASVMAATRWLIEHPNEGVRLPDELPHRQILADAMPYLGPFVSQATAWTPLTSWDPALEPFRRPTDPADTWQFATFLVD